MSTSPISRAALTLTLLLGSGCTNSTPNGAECEVYCEGIYVCAQNETCSWTASQAEVRAACVDVCIDVAATMTQTQVMEAVDCLRCLEGGISRTDCSGTASTAAEACSTVCFGRGDGVNVYNTRFAERFNPSSGLLRCM